MNRHRFFSLFPVLAAALLLLTAGCLEARTWYTVRWVDDGDTIVLDDGRRVRYIGVNTPEIAHEDRKAEPFGDRAKALNSKWVLKKQVRLEFDRQRHDRYGRLLAYVFLKDGTFINERLVGEGMAYCLYLRPNVKYHGQLLKAQQAAMKSSMGLWQGWQEKTARYIGNKRSRRFHLPTCSFAKKIKPKNRVIFATRWDAFFAGFAPAKRCLRQYWSYSF